MWEVVVKGHLLILTILFHRDVLCSLSHRTKIWREHSGSDVFGIYEHLLLSRFWYRILFFFAFKFGWVVNYTFFLCCDKLRTHLILTLHALTFNFLVLGTHRQRDLACIYVHFNRMFLVFDTSILLFREKKTLTQFCRNTNVYITYGNPVS